MLKKWIAIGMTVLAGLTASCDATSGQINLEAGYRRDQISITDKFYGSGSSDRVEAKSKFKNLDIFQIALDGRVALGYNFYLRADAYWGWILDGNYEASLAVGEGDASDCSGGWQAIWKNKNLISDRYVYGLSGAIGYPFWFCDCTTMLAPVIGYSTDHQSLKFDKFNDCSCCDCCDDDYDSHLGWYGPFVGLDLEYRPHNSCFIFYVNGEYHWGTVRVKRFGDFENLEHKFHNNRVRGWAFTAGVDYDFACDWTAGLYVSVEDWSGSKKHHAHCSDGSDNNGSNNNGSHRSSNSDYHVKNEPHWHTYSISLCVGHDF